MAGRMASRNRLQKELQSFLKDPPSGMSVEVNSVKENISVWTINMIGTKGTLYDGEQFKLQLTFESTYPFEAPIVKFVGENIPIHPHVYSNGHICLSILTEDWTPALSIQSVCVSILSMLSSCKEKIRPVDDMDYVLMGNKNPKKANWNFHDNEV